MWKTKLWKYRFIVIFTIISTWLISILHCIIIMGWKTSKTLPFIIVKTQMVINISIKLKEKKNENSWILENFFNLKKKMVEDVYSKRHAWMIINLELLPRLNHPLQQKKKFLNICNFFFLLFILITNNMYKEIIH